MQLLAVAESTNPGRDTARDAGGVWQAGVSANKNPCAVATAVRNQSCGNVTKMSQVKTNDQQWYGVVPDFR